ncbi:MAG: putative DNA binding domain-containing protein, partial [Bacteroidaceae bacterium]|nr:putative DNA binding domain-containing protein [Bacteroidaceae bacterium]
MNKECQIVEYKRLWKNDYLAWISGYANAQGGIIQIGVADDRTVVGLDNATKLLEDLPNIIRDVLGIVVDVDLLEQDGKDYIEITVSPSSVPISYHGKYFYRSGSTNQELKGAALQEFILKKMGRQWDDLVCEGATMKDIDPDAIAYFIESGIDSQRLNPKVKNTSASKILENYQLVTEDGKLKNAAILLFGKNPKKFFTGIEFKIGRFGNSISDLIFQDKIEGNILQMADRVMDVLKSKYLTSPIHYKGMRRIEPLELPEEGLREILYNAICHKLYGGAPIQMRVYNDSVNIWNDGELPVGYSVDTLLGEHGSKPRNHHIAEIFHDAGFIEAWGRGYEKIEESFSAAGLPMP